MCLNVFKGTDGKEVVGVVSSLLVAAHLVALLKDVISEVVNGVSGSYSVHVDHALGKHGDNSLHQELAHVPNFAVFKFFHVVSDLVKALLL